MNNVRLGDVVKRVKEKVDKKNTELEYYIGGEHFDSGEIIISKKGIIKESTIGPAFHMKFQPGHVLLMSRNPHLRKAGVVNFEGICSDVSYVCETKDEAILSQKFLPFIFQTESFWTFAEENKKGSTNFFLNWSDFERFEFKLPNITEQEKLSNLLWAATNSKEAYKKLIFYTDELVKSQFIEMFGAIQNNQSKYSFTRLGDICKLKSGGTPSRKNPEFSKGNIPWITTISLGNNYINENDAVEFITEDAIKNSATKLIPSNSLLFGTRVGVGKCSINLVPMCTNQDIMSITGVDQNQYSLVFIKKVLETYVSFFNNHKRGATIKGITADLLRNIKIPKAPINVQDEYTEFVHKTDKSKFDLKQTIESLENMIKSIMLKNIG